MDYFLTAVEGHFVNICFHISRSRIPGSYDTGLKCCSLWLLPYYFISCAPVFGGSDSPHRHFYALPVFFPYRHQCMILGSLLWVWFLFFKNWESEASLHVSAVVFGKVLLQSQQHELRYPSLYYCLVSFLDCQCKSVRLTTCKLNNL